MLPAVGVGVLILLLLGRRGSGTAGAPNPPTTPVSKSGTASRNLSGVATAQLNHDFANASSKLGVALPPGTDPNQIPDTIKSMVVSCFQAGHGCDKNSVAETIARYYQNQSELSPASLALLERIAGAVPGVGGVMKGLIAGAEALSSAGPGNLGNTRYAVAGSAAKLQAGELKPHPVALASDPGFTQNLAVVVQRFNAASPDSQAGLLRAIRAALTDQNASVFAGFAAAGNSADYSLVGVSDAELLVYYKLHSGSKRLTTEQAAAVRAAFQGLL